LDTDSQRDGDDGRERLWHDGNCKGDAEDHHVDEWLATQQSKSNDGEHNRQCADRERATHAIQVFLQGRLARLSGGAG
jgi:hypothetical protein